jgi:cation:H+ antiporter
VLAAVRGESDIAVGNVVGSNVFNILGILGLASLARPLAGVDMSAVDLGVMVLLTVALLPLMKSGFRITRTEGATLLGGYVAYLAYLLA